MNNNNNYMKWENDDNYTNFSHFIKLFTQYQDGEKNMLELLQSKKISSAE